MIGFWFLSVGTARGVVQHHAGSPKQSWVLEVGYHNLCLLHREKGALSDDLSNLIFIVLRQNTRQDHQRWVDHVQDVHNAQTEGSAS